MEKGRINVLVTSGGTDCPIDDVRVVTNIGTGTFGSQLAEEFLKKQCNVIYLHSSGAVKPIYRHCAVKDLNNFELEIDRIKKVFDENKNLAGNINFIEVKDFDEYEEKVLNINENIDIWVMAMAVSDYRPIKLNGKMSSSKENFNLQMERCPKVISELRQKNRDAFIVGFKLSSNITEEQIISNVTNWIYDRDVDMCVANDMTGRKSEHREVYLLRKNSPEYQFYSGENVSKDLVEEILHEYTEKAKIKIGKEI